MHVNVRKVEGVRARRREAKCDMRTVRVCKREMERGWDRDRWRKRGKVRGGGHITSHPILHADSVSW